MSGNSSNSTYLIFADQSQDFHMSLRYAARLAQAHGAHPAIIRVIEPHDFTHWGNIESRMRDEMRKEAEQMVWSMARDIYDHTGLVSSLYVEEGSRYDILTKIIQTDPMIKMFIVSADTADGSGPGPMIAHYAGKGLSSLGVPLHIVPTHIGPDGLENLV